jgi:hypothetical protein
MTDALMQDLKYAMRGLRAKPGFTAAVVLTLALGTGANAAMFGIVDRMLFRPAPYLIEPATAHRVYPAVMVRGKERISGGTEYATFADIRDGTTSFSLVGGISNLRLAVGVGDDAKEMRVAGVNAAFFKFFDAPALVGRYFTSAEDSIPVGAPVAVLNYATWEIQYGKRADVIGERVQIGPVIYTIIGVAPRSFVGVWSDVPPAYFIPITSYAASQAANASWLKGKQWWTTYSWGWMQMMVRRKPGVSVEAANTDLLNAARRSYQRQLVEDPKGTPMALAKTASIPRPILTEAGPNGTSARQGRGMERRRGVVVLLIACANVANLLLARAAAAPARDRRSIGAGCEPKPAVETARHGKRGSRGARRRCRPSRRAMGRCRASRAIVSKNGRRVDRHRRAHDRIRRDRCPVGRAAREPRARAPGSTRRSHERSQIRES